MDLALPAYLHATPSQALDLAEQQLAKTLMIDVDLDLSGELGWSQHRLLAANTSIQLQNVSVNSGGTTRWCKCQPQP